MIIIDFVIPVSNGYRNDSQNIRHLETARTYANSRWARDEHSDSTTRYRHNLEFTPSSKVLDLSRPKLEILRANSPTLKRLLAARVKLEKYANALSRAASASRHSYRSTRETIPAKPNQPVFNPNVVTGTSHGIFFC